jgi:uncharacterized phiE125 gp8 family phage protein
MLIRDYILITPATIEPITLDEVKQKLRLIGNSDFDSELTRMITVAREMCERITGRDLINKTYKGFLDCYFNQVEFRKSKLQSISSIKYYSNNILTTLSSTSYYFTNATDYSQLVFTQNFTADNRLQAIEIEFIAGYGSTASTVPTSLKEAMLSFIDWLFNNSGDCTNEDSLMARKLFQNYIIGKKIFFTI